MIKVETTYWRYVLTPSEGWDFAEPEIHEFATKEEAETWIAENNVRHKRINKYLDRRVDYRFIEGETDATDLQRTDHPVHPSAARGPEEAL